MAKGKVRHARPPAPPIPPPDVGIFVGDGSPSAAGVAAEMQRNEPIDLEEARMGVARKNGLMRRPKAIKRRPKRRPIK